VSAATAQTCIGQPLSWLVLERHALAELEGAAARAADQHLAECAACASALGTIKADRRALPSLPALPDAAQASGLGPRASGGRPQASGDELAEARARSEKRRRWMIGAGVVVAAAAALLLVIIRPKTEQGELVGARVRVKGAGVVVMTLVRERDGNVTFDPPDVRDTDRWKVQLTCAPGGGAYVEVVVEQAGAMPAVALPSQRFACANNVVIPGAFRITGGAATICARLLPTDAPSSPTPVLPVKACARLDGSQR
jgi:hypothetical protein